MQRLKGIGTVRAKNAWGRFLKRVDHSLADSALPSYRGDIWDALI
jgi:hypothetical protein